MTVQAAARKTGRRVLVLHASNEGEIDAVFAGFNNPSTRF